MRHRFDTKRTVIMSRSDDGARIAALRCDPDSTMSSIAQLPFLEATTLTSMALETAKAELTQSRSGVPTVIMVVTDGLPLSEKKTKKVATKIKATDGVRLMMVPVSGHGMTADGLSFMTELASMPKEDNMKSIDSFDTLNQISTIDMFVAGACPSIGN